MNAGKLELVIMAGQESKAWLADLTTQLDRMERLTAKGGKTASAKNAPVEDEAEETDEFETASLRTPAKKAAASFDDEDDEATMAKLDEAPAKKGRKGAPAKVTLEAVNAAAKARVARYVDEDDMEGADARAKVLKTLKKKFNVASLTELEETQYAEAIEALNE